MCLFLTIKYDKRNCKIIVVVYDSSFESCLSDLTDTISNWIFFSLSLSGSCNLFIRIFCALPITLLRPCTWLYSMSNHSLCVSLLPIFSLINLYFMHLHLHEFVALAFDLWQTCEFQLKFCAKTHDEHFN